MNVPALAKPVHPNDHSEHQWFLLKALVQPIISMESRSPVRLIEEFQTSLQRIPGL